MTRFGGLVFLAATIAALVAGQARAALVYEAEAATSLRITGFMDASGTPIAKPAGLEIFADPDNAWSDELADWWGNATAGGSGASLVDAIDPFDLQVGEGLVQETATLGNADAPPYSWAESHFFAEGLIVAENLSPDTVTIAFEFLYDYRAFTSADDPAQEPGEASVEIHLHDDFGSVFEAIALSDTDFGGESTNPGFPGSDTVAFQTTLAPGEPYGVWLGTFAYGYGFAGPCVIPEPSTFIIWSLLGALGITVGSRRRSVSTRR